MKKKIEEIKIEVIFKNDFDARNKLITFIINKILEDYHDLEGMISGNKNYKRGGCSGECN